MKLYFLRHAHALDGPDDDVRPISPKGEKQSRKIGRFLQRAEIKFDRAFTSPLLRAKQTAEIVLQVSAQPKTTRLQIAEALRNETSQAAFDRWLRSLSGAEHVLLVGHAPSMPERVCKLLGVKNPQSMELPKAGLACVEAKDRRSASLDFFVSPKVL